MKKRMIGITFIVAFVAMTGYNVCKFQKNKSVSELTIANVEALADGESGGGSSNSWACWSARKDGLGFWLCGNPCSFQENYGPDGTEGTCYKNN